MALTLTTFRRLRSADSRRLRSLGRPLPELRRQSGTEYPFRGDLAFLVAATNRGHRMAAPLKLYAHCIDGQGTAANQRITEALGIGDAEPGPGNESDNDAEQAF